MVAEFSAAPADQSPTDQVQTFADVTFKFRDNDNSNEIDLAEFLTLGGSLLRV